MRYRGFLSLAILAAAACSTGVDGPTPDLGPAFAREGVKPPPPLGSGDTEISISFEPVEEGEFAAGGPSAASSSGIDGFFILVHGRYFANGPGTNGWIEFVSDVDCTASPNARLSYNGKTHKTNGRGTVTCGDVVLDLSKVEITGGGFGNCELNFYGQYVCESFQFSYDGVPGGTVQITPESE